MSPFEVLTKEANALPPEPWWHQRWREARKLMFRRGFMPDSCYDEMQEHLRHRMDEILAPLDAVPGRTLLSSDGRDETAYRQQIDAAQRASITLLVKALTEEAEKQWNKIVDRRSEQFLFVMIGLGLGIPLGLLL
jgi:hypothetical protein